jgi:phosphopantothenoylcysteine decarboxylase / phosphopantothenate---cysteine ligase
MHPSKKVTLRDSALAGKRIVIGITGSIAAVETVRLIRELLRHGAEVIPVMSKEAENIIHPYSIEFAAGMKPITEITGQVEHVLYCGDAETAVDLVLICPATANTISKIACGIDDTPVTTFATTALGTGIPLLVCPSMHGTMYEHTIVVENIEKLRSMGVGFIDPQVSEGKAKMSSRIAIVEHVIRTLSKYGQEGMAGKRVLIIGGSTAQPIDAMRVLSNRSSGGTAIALAKEAFRKGANVELWYGESRVPIPEWLEPVERFVTVDDLLDLVKELRWDADPKRGEGFDVIILCAAISDYTPVIGDGIIGSDDILKVDDSLVPHGKIPSGKDEVVIRLLPTPKIIDIVRSHARDSFLVGYKAEAGISEEELVERAEGRMKEIGCDLMVANLLENVGAKATRVYVIDRDGDVGEMNGTREQIAGSLFEAISNLIADGQGIDRKLIEKEKGA